MWGGNRKSVISAFGFEQDALHRVQQELHILPQIPGTPFVKILFTSGYAGPVPLNTFAIILVSIDTCGYESVHNPRRMGL